MLVFFFIIISPKHTNETKQTVHLTKFEPKARTVFEKFLLEK